MKLSVYMIAIAMIAAGFATADEAELPVLEQTSCIVCHGDSEQFEEEDIARVEQFRADVHAAVGLSCHDCHGGDPDNMWSEDMDGAMNEDLEENPFIGKPEKVDIPGLCGKCHSDPTYMKRFLPDPRVDQEREYWTSGHGLALAAGDEDVATCIDCHDVHGIMGVAIAQSPVYPTNVAETCNRCHGDSDLMASHTLSDGSAMPVDQFARWRRSVHAAALYDKGDISAPTCNDCHGNHGAAPPEVESVAFVCGRCHGREAGFFRESDKKFGFEGHNEAILDEGAESCADCHDEDALPRPVRHISSFTECTTCHENHAVVRPTAALLGNIPPSPCVFCHEGPAGGDRTVVDDSHEGFVEERDRLLAEAEGLGLSGHALFDWMVDQTLLLSQHALSEEPNEEGEMVLRPEFAELFKKFRIGKTTYTYENPVNGEVVTSNVIQCDQCHVAGEEESGEGAVTAVTMLEKMHELKYEVASAERLLLRAKRGGVETHEAMIALDQAIDSQIELEVLVHTFSVDPEGEFMKKFDEGIAFAEEAREAGVGSLDELGARRKGLVVALIIIAVVLVGLFFKIRELTPRA